ncbi:MAG: S8 family serine peptidase [Oscillospiraceae bacterium]|nr:S8 family serine peptidase [Oscillospiraceae bacterium]
MSGPGTAFARDCADTGYIVKYRDGAARPATDDTDCPFDVVDARTLHELRAAGAVEWFERDRDVQLSDADISETGELCGSLSPYYSDEMWHLDMIDADLAYSLGCEGEGVRIGVVDSGVSAHPALAACLTEGYNYLDGNSDTSDTLGHGTSVAGLIAGVDSEGHMGVAPKATLVPLKCFDKNSSKVSKICQAIYGGVDDFDCDILNLSLGFSQESLAMYEAVEYAAEKGVLVISAVGNGGTMNINFPAKYDNVLAVGSIGKDGLISPRSNYGYGVIITAPGETVKTTYFNSGYAQVSGTSYAVPMVSGAAAVLMSMDPSLSFEDVTRILYENATDKGKEGYDPTYGWGVLNLDSAVKAVIGDRPVYIAPPAADTTAIYNNSDGELNCLYLLSEYDEDGRIKNVTVRKLLMQAGEVAAVPAPGKGTTAAQFVCDLHTLRPLAEARDFHYE